MSFNTNIEKMSLSAKIYPLGFMHFYDFQRSFNSSLSLFDEEQVVKASYSNRQVAQYGFMPIEVSFGYALSSYFKLLSHVTIPTFMAYSSNRKSIFAEANTSYWLASIGLGITL